MCAPDTGNVLDTAKEEFQTFCSELYEERLHCCNYYAKRKILLFIFTAITEILATVVPPLSKTAAISPIHDLDSNLYHS